MSKTVRIATVLATGDRFLVNSIDFRTDRVFCWGQVNGARGASTTHEPGGPRFDLSAVRITEVPKTEQLCRELFLQGVEALRAKGVTVALSGRKNVTATIYVTSK